jgi:hypothetical protein
MLRPTVCRPVCLGIKHPIWGLRPDFYYCQPVAGLLMWGALSDDMTGLSFTTATGPRQRSYSRVRVQWNSLPYFTVSDSILPFSSPPTTRRATVDTFDPTSAWDTQQKIPLQHFFYCCVKQLPHGPHRAHRFQVSPFVRVRSLMPSNGRCLQRHHLATGLHTTILSSHLCLGLPSDLFPSSFQIKICMHFSSDSAVRTATGYWLDGREVGVRVPVGARFFLLSTSSRPILGPTKPPIQWVTGAISPGGKNLTTRLQLLPRSRIRGSVQPLPHTSSWRSV